MLVAVLYVLTARSMPPAEYGILATAVALGMIGGGFIDLGSSPYWIRELASGRITLEQLQAQVTTKFVAACAVAILIVLVASFKDPTFIATGVLLLTSTTVIMVLVPLRAARRARAVGVLTAVDRTVAVIAYFALLAVGVELGPALWISLAVGDLLLIIYVSRFEFPQFFRFNSRKLRNPWAGAKWYSLNAFGASAQLLDLPLLSILAGASAAGIYGGVNRWTQPMILAATSFASAAAPFLASHSDLRAARSQVLRASWMLALVVLLGFGVILAAPKLVILLLGDAYASSASVLQWLGGATILNAIAQPLLAALMSRRFDRLASVIFIISVISQISIVGIFAPNSGAISAGIGVFVAQLLQVLGYAVLIAVISYKRRS